MKREILFKGRRVDNGEWVYGNYFHNFRKVESHSIIQFDSNNWHEVHPQTVCQFTGLLDKNGKKIFEGDYDQNYEVVKWCEKRIGYSLFVYDHPTKEFIHCNCYSCEEHYELSEVINQIEIISNIHD